MTPTDQEKLAKIREWCVKACFPDALWDEQMKDWYFTNGNGGFMLPPLGIAQVLRSIQRKVTTAIGVDMNGAFINCDDNLNNLTFSECMWNLADDNLAHQTPDTIDFLYQLIPQS